MIDKMASWAQSGARCLGPAIAGGDSSDIELVSGQLEAGEEDEVVGDDRGPDVGFEVIKAAPGAAGQAVGALEA